ncbi:MAG: FAD-dependent oxidoreductase, partial [Chloroflexi bacterium]|nr:FAD-dependent oxidoreductase [Chloroflexota bacterium]
VVVAQATTEVDGYDIRNTYQGLREVAAKAARYFPALAPLQVIRCWAAVTPYTPDGQPALGFLRDVPNLLVAASFHSAVGLAPAVGQVVSDLIVDGRANVDLTPWSPERLWREGGWSGGGGC